MTGVTRCSRAQEKTTAEPRGGLKRCGPYSGKVRCPPSYSPLLRNRDMAKRRCAVKAEVSSRWARKWPPACES